MDRELYLPEAWSGDPARRRDAGVPQEAEFATKPRLAQAMLARAFATGVPFAWVTADEAYGQAKYLRVWLEQHDASYVLATRCNDDVFSLSHGAGRVDEMIAALPPRAWRRVSAGDGAHGRREYDWAPLQTSRTPTAISAVAVLTGPCSPTSARQTVPRSGNEMRDRPR